MYSKHMPKSLRGHSCLLAQTNSTFCVRASVLRAFSTRMFDERLGWTDCDWASWRTGLAVMLWRGVWCDDEDEVVAGRWRARVRERRVSHLVLAIRMERLTRSTWGSSARGTGGEWGALFAVSAPAVSPPLLGCDISDSKFGESTDI